MWGWLAFPLVRAATLHVRASSFAGDGLVGVLEDWVARFREALDRVGVRPWTIRLSLQPLNSDEYGLIDGIASRLGEFAEKEKVLVAGLHVEAGHGLTRRLLQALEGLEGVYGSVLASGMEGLGEYVDALYRGVGYWETYTRIAVVFPRRPITPYFPAASTVKEGLTFALRYVDLLHSTIKKGNVEELRRFLREKHGECMRVAGELGVECLGLDVSPSPWMDESITQVIESIAGTTIPNPGTAWAINWLNNLVLREAEKAGVRVTGFNEVMLSVAEDNTLKNRVLEGKVKLRDLALLSAYCIAGIDMAAISTTTTSRQELLNLLYDTYTASKVKKNSLGVRLIPTTSRPGEKLYSKKFGTIPVAATT